MRGIIPENFRSWKNLVLKIWSLLGFGHAWAAFGQTPFSPVWYMVVTWYWIPGGPKKTIHILKVPATDATTCKWFRHFRASSLYIFRQESAISGILERFRQIYEVLQEGMSFSKPAKFWLTSMVPIFYSALRSLLLSPNATHIIV